MGSYLANYVHPCTIETSNQADTQDLIPPNRQYKLKTKCYRCVKRTGVDPGFLKGGC